MADRYSVVLQGIAFLGEEKIMDGEGVGGKCSSRLEWTWDVWEILRPPRIGQGSAIRGRLEAVLGG